MEIVIRPFQPGDLEVLQRLTIESFEGYSVDQNVESRFGILHGHAWRWRKARHVEEGVAYAMIETMVGNEIGEHLYPACGFAEVGRQIHYAIQL